MAKGVKVFSDNIDTINSELEKKIEELKAIEKEIKKNKTLISESWKSASAMSTVEKINDQIKKLNEAIKEVEKAESLVKSTSKKVLEADFTIIKNLGRQFY